MWLEEFEKSSKKKAYTWYWYMYMVYTAVYTQVFTYIFQYVNEQWQVQKNMNLKYYVLKYFTQREKVWIST